MTNDSAAQIALRSSTIDVPTLDGVADCYLTRPQGNGPHRAVLMICDIIGLRPLIETMADRIAAEGYVVLAPNIFYRAGRAPLWDVPEMADEHAHAAFVESIRPLLQALSVGAVSADATAYLDRLGEECDGSAGIAGYCLGGRLGWYIAATSPERIAALAGFHTGRMATAQPSSPHLMAPQVGAEIYWGHADKDETMTAEDIAVLDQAMDEAGLSFTTEVYAGCGHGYTMKDEGTFSEEGRDRAYAALFSLFKRALAA